MTSFSVWRNELCRQLARQMQRKCKLIFLDSWKNGPTFADAKLLHQQTQMKTVKLMKKMMLMMTALLMCAVSVNAQTTKVDDKELVGAWMMESMQWEGEKKTMCGKTNGYTQFKYYGADGEYACCQIVLSNTGEVVIMPHEYGTYTFHDRMYSEMGRPAIKDAIILTDKNTCQGTWNNRHDIWKKQTALPDRVVRYIVDCCKKKETPADIQQSIKQNMFK